MRREVFGPVVSVTRFSDAEQVVQWPTTQTTASPARSGPGIRPCQQGGQPPAIRLHLDQHPLHAHPEMPYGGMKMSGYGKDLSSTRWRDYTVPRHIMVKL